ncbi:MAG: 50S ribosomal protein L20 [Candidatus Omnitrophica bacterium CG11_big_fil_rev_8_21_14_0_20_64_10]|nr:MAG: 50S ribosomal protein L20 [Candidatus Omnitrophica bacterium CG11_big_fil_rev_8_21_14_0_20_64_10]
MSRVKTAVPKKKRHKRVLKAAKGAWGRRSKLFRRAKETVMRGMAFATRDRKARKGEFRRLWIVRIQAACRQSGIPYNRFIQGLKTAQVGLDRKMLAELAVNDPDAFKTLVELTGTQKKAA